MTRGGLMKDYNLGYPTEKDYEHCLQWVNRSSELRQKHVQKEKEFEKNDYKKQAEYYRAKSFRILDCFTLVHNKYYRRNSMKKFNESFCDF